MSEQQEMTALEQASEAAQAGRLDDADALLDRLVTETPTDASAHFMRFAVAMQRRDFASARERAEAALEHLPDDPRALCNLGTVLMRTGDPAGAMKHFDAAVDAGPEYFFARRNRGMLYAQLDQYADAAEDLTVAVRLEPEQGDTRMALANARIESGQFKEAAAIIQESAKLGIGERIGLNYLWGRLMYRMGRYADARRTFADVLSAAPDAMQHYRALAAASFHCGDTIHAKRITRGAISKFPTDIRSDGEPVLQVLVLEAMGDDYFTNIGRYPVSYAQGNFPNFLPAGRIAYTHILADNIDRLEDVVDLSQFDIALNNRPVFERINARGHSDRVDRMASALPIPLINTPAAVKETTRERNAQRFADAEQFTFPHTIRVAHEADVAATSERILAEMPFPIILRPLHTNSGHGVVLIQNEQDLSEVLKGHPFAEFYAIAYHDCQSDDGFFRRYRLANVGGQLIPCGLHIGSGWNVHGEGREELDWSGLGLDKEEIAFYEDPATVLGNTPEDFFREITDAIDLDIYGFDFGHRRDGRVIIYEINAAMGLSLAGAEMGSSHRAPYRAAIIRDIEDYLFDRAGKSPPAGRP